jgi:hypothetical protein
MSVFMYMRNVESNIAQNEMNTRVKAIAKGGWKEGPVFSGRKEPLKFSARAAQGALRLNRPLTANRLY